MNDALKKFFHQKSRKTTLDYILENFIFNIYGKLLNRARINRLWKKVSCRRNRCLNLYRTHHAVLTRNFERFEELWWRNTRLRWIESIGTEIKIQWKVENYGDLLYDLRWFLRLRRNSLDFKFSYDSMINERKKPFFDDFDGSCKIYCLNF